eukprot:SAG11_NODE_17241_length_524_cov_0.990588_1_plen_57_part_10
MPSLPTATCVHTFSGIVKVPHQRQHAGPNAPCNRPVLSSVEGIRVLLGHPAQNHTKN